MLLRPRDLADRTSGAQQPEIFTLPIDAARCKAREIIDQVPQGGYVQVDRKLAAASRRSDRVHDAMPADCGLNSIAKKAAVPKRIGI